MSLRRTLLFIPGNNPGMLQNGGVLGADALAFDLEDAVAPREKDAARFLVGHALRNVDYGTSEKVVRINALDTFAAIDIPAIIPCRPDALLVPKVDSAEDIHQVVAMIKAAERPGQKEVVIFALIETPLGIENAFQIASADKRVVAICLGAEDYTAGLGAERTKGGQEIFSARTKIVNAAMAAGVHPMDTPWTDVTDETGLVEDTVFAKQLGFKGKLTINPRHVDAIHKVFNPTPKEVAWAERVVAILKEAEAQGAGAISLDGKMIDKPIVDRAERVIALAKLLGIEGGN